MRTKSLSAILVTAFLVAGSASVIAGSSPDRGYREVTLPAGTVLPLVLDSYVATDTSRIESPVRAHVRRPVVVNGVTVIPAGSAVGGHVTHSERGGRVSGRAQLAFRFDRLSLPDPNRHFTIATSSVSRVARSTRGRDAKTIAIPAAGGAVVGAIVGGKKGAAVGAAAGGGGGTAVALSTRGPDVRMGRGTAVAVRLLRPITVRVPADAR